jgi:hypothetical protein
MWSRNSDHLVDVFVFCCKLYDVYVIVMQAPVSSSVQQQVAKGHVVCCGHFAPVKQGTLTAHTVNMPPVRNLSSVVFSPSFTKAKKCQ